MRIAAVLLAAGASGRFGGANKLLAEFGGKPIVRYVGDMLAVCALDPTIAVTGRDQAAIEATLSGLDLTCVHHPRWQDGMGGSIAVGIAALAEDVDAAFIVPGDMPFLTRDVMRILTSVFERTGADQPIVFPMLDGHVQTNPVLWPRRFFEALAQLSGPAGAKSLLIRNVGDTRGIAFDDADLFRDIDTEADLEVARRIASL